ncbi:MAG: murein L,D-transpeptidase family protein [Pseudomonadota bacterium]
MVLRIVKNTAIAASLVALSGCTGVFESVDNRGNVPIPKKLLTSMKAKGMTPRSPIMIRVFKKENELEIWKRKTDTGRYGLLATYEICKWSGKLGPKYKEGDKQAPEGFYTVNKWQMNPNSEYHLAFNMGFPNRFDRAYGRTGSHLMIHGACSSAGCYSMTDEYIEDIYSLAREALKGGQKSFQVQAFPFRMTPENMAAYRDHKHFKFWTMLKRGYDHFQITRVPPKVNVCEKRYVFNTTAAGPYNATAQCPAMTMPATLATAFVAKQKRDAKAFESLVAKQEKRPVQSVTGYDAATLLAGISTETAAKSAVTGAAKPAPARASEKAQSSKTSAKKTIEGALKPAG